MDEENALDFQALRAKFQDEELLLKQPPKTKPALPEKPKVVPPPHSPPHYIPPGGRPSLLTTINQNLDRKNPIAPRVIFKDEKKESKKPLLPTNSKTKDTKVKMGKDKSKGSKERLNDEPPEQKPKKEPKEKKKETTAELVPATPPPKNTTLKKRGFLGFKKSKRESLEIPAEPILDSSSSEVSGPVPLIPVPPELTSPEPETSAPKALMPDIPTLPDSTVVEVTPPPTIPASLDFTPPSTFTPEVPASPEPPASLEPPAPPEAPALEIETPEVAETVSVSHLSSQNDTPPSRTPPPITPEQDGPPLEVAPAPSTPSPEPETAAAEPIDIAALEIPPPPLIVEPPEIPPSPKAEHSVSALSVLERAEDMSPGKRTPPGDQRIFNALEKARKMAQSHHKPSTSPRTMTPPPEEHPIPEGQTQPLFELPPIDYEERMGKGLQSKPEPVNGLDHRSSLVLEGIAEEGSDAIPELLVVPPPPPKRVLPEPESLGAPPTKPPRLPSVDLSAFSPPPPLEDNAAAIPAPPEFSETDTDLGAQTDVPEFDDVTSDANSPELPVSEWDNSDYNGPDTTDLPRLPEYHSNGVILPVAEVNASPVFEEKHQENPESPNNRDSLIIMPGADSNNPYESTDNLYEDVSASATKKKKTEGKKRKGPPKNPYAETPETTEEKTKTGRFGKSDKKAAVESPDEKELKKKEKQRLEKEKKELKEKQEREKKEQKEREKKENEMKKKFKITGQEDAMYEAKVTVTTKGRKNDLPVKSGDNISIIRTTNCPKGKWLARDSSNNYGYVAVDHVNLDIKEMLELGKKAAVNRKSSSNIIEPEVTSTGSRASNHFPLTESFTDDSEEWTCDDDEPLSPVEPTDPQAPLGHTRTLSMPDMGNKDVSVNHQHSHSDLADSSHLQARHEALQKLATFFYAPKPTAVEPTASADEPDTSPEVTEEAAAPVPEATPEMDLEDPDTIILPPPELYADDTLE